jgi:superfamily I DNA/RNA helicase
MLRLAGTSIPEKVVGTVTQEFWTRALPEVALSVLADRGPRFDFLIIDEAQDLAEPAYLDVLDALLEGGLSAGRWRMFGDFERQAIYSRAPAEAVDAVVARGVAVARCCLRRNCRNTPRVAEYIVRLGGLSPAYTRVLRPDCGPEGTPRTSFYPSGEHQSSLLRATLDELLASGEYAPEDIVVLSPVNGSCAERLYRSGKYPRLAPLHIGRSGSAGYGTVASFKGLEAPAIVLTDIEEVATERAQRLFYIGVSRATDHLNVFARDGLQGEVARLVTGGGDGVH